MSSFRIVVAAWRLAAACVHVCVFCLLLFKGFKLHVDLLMFLEAVSLANFLAVLYLQHCMSSDHKKPVKRFFKKCSCLSTESERSFGFSLRLTVSSMKIRKLAIT